MYKSGIAVAFLLCLQFASGQATPIGPPIGPPENAATGSNVPRLDDKKFLKEAALDGNDRNRARESRR